MTLALVEAVDGEAGDQDHADGIRRHRPDHLAGASARRTEPMVRLK